MATVEILLKEISGLEINEGDRLPSERILAERCSISRTSIRNALKDLQSSSILASRERSGYYLASKFALRQALSGKSSTWSLERLLQLLEARNFVEPQVTALAAEVIATQELARLEQCLVDMGRASVGANTEQWTSCHRQFFAICQESCPNQEFVRMLDEVRVPISLLVAVLHEVSEMEKKLFFADHVNLFQALKHTEVEKVGEIVAQTNTRIAYFFKTYPIELSETGER